jgi:hypothetical protein
MSDRSGWLSKAYEKSRSVLSEGEAVSLLRRNGRRPMKIVLNDGVAFLVAPL